MMTPTDPEMEARPGILRYRELEARRTSIREDNGTDSPEEYAVLDEMDFLWWEVLTQEESDYINSHVELFHEGASSCRPAS